MSFTRSNFSSQFFVLKSFSFLELPSYIHARKSSLFDIFATYLRSRFVFIPLHLYIPSLTTPLPSLLRFYTLLSSSRGEYEGKGINRACNHHQDIMYINAHDSPFTMISLHSEKRFFVLES